MRKKASNGPYQELNPNPETRQTLFTLGEPGQQSRCATRSEKLAHLQGLTREEYAKLLRWAEFTAMKFRGKVNDCDGGDLLHKAILQALEDSRKWRPERVDFRPLWEVASGALAIGGGNAQNTRSRQTCSCRPSMK